MTERKWKGTPGPWEIGKRHILSDGSGDGFNFSGGDVEIFPPLGEAGPIAIVSDDANARAIAAAPQMWELLRKIEARYIAYDAALNLRPSEDRLEITALLDQIDGGKT